MNSEIFLENGKAQSATIKDQIRLSFGTIIFVGMNKIFILIMNVYLKRFWANACPFMRLNIITNKTHDWLNYG